MCNIGVGSFYFMNHDFTPVSSDLAQGSALYQLSYGLRLPLPGLGTLALGEKGGAGCKVNLCCDDCPQRTAVGQGIRGFLGSVCFTDAHRGGVLCPLANWIPVHGLAGSMSPGIALDQPLTPLCLNFLICKMGIINPSRQAPVVPCPKFLQATLSPLSCSQCERLPRTGFSGSEAKIPNSAQPMTCSKTLARSTPAPLLWTSVFPSVPRSDSC